MLNSILVYFKALFSFQLPQHESSTLWSDTDTNTAISMSINGCTIKDIAIKLNRSESAVYQKLRRLKSN